MAAEAAGGKYRSTVSKSKDPSGLLISVIRTLSTSDDVEDRENEKGRLEEAYEKCDRDLDELIVQHYTELTTAIRTYQSITERITNSRNKIKQVKENLLSCKMLLHCKRDELRKLWIEGIEHKHVLNLLDEIENIKQVPQKLEQCMASKHYLSATDMLVSAVESLEGPLLQVEGLSDLRLELHSKKMNLHLVLIDELHRHLYIKSTSRVVQRNKEKGRVSSLIKDASPVPLIDVTNLPTPRKFLDASQFSTPGSSSVKEINLQDIKEDLELDPEENSTLFMGILIKGLAKLKKIPETVKAIKERLEQELQQIVKRSTTQVADSSYQRGENLTVENQPRLLLELLELLFDKFNAVATAHSVVLGYLQDTVVTPLAQQEDVKLYDMADVWVKIQDVLQMLLTEYLDMKNTRTASEPSAQLSYASTGRDFAAFFAKKKPQRPKNSLFKFESSSHAISMSAYLREQRRELYSRSGELQGGPDDNLIEGGGTKFVCKPGARNITVIFHPLLRFIQEIEHALGLGPAKQCPLRDFLTVYIKNIFLNQVLAEINKEIEGVTKTSDPLKILANADTMKVMGVQRPLLQSTIIVEKTVQDLMNLMHDLSAYSDQFLNMVCVKLQEYKDTCAAACRGIVQSEEKLVISASWAKDDDISRLLKSLPNWVNMAQPKQLRPKREEEEDFIRAAFGKESEVLIGNLGDKLIPPQDILRDVSDLKALANMHESLEWLAGRTKSAFSNLSTSQMLSPAQESHVNMDLPPVSEQIMQTLSELARSFQDMADRCLLVLHLEVRVHCFHYLIPLAKEGNYAIVANVESMDYDPLVVKLNKDISAIEEAMSASLQQHKFQYIFEGLGHLISCILINGAQYFRRISESGIKKMCRNIFVLQQNLTNITMSREADLDFARQYYEMLYNTADELLNLVVDQGVKYTELEYIHALTLLHRSQTGVGDQTTQNMRLQRLKEIICEQAAIKQATKDKKITTV
ncbi:exocyst complex component 4 isoform X1 [Prionailurus viverrinus]|uniref:Exocyst complex component Sec8 n=3 Tax=Felinae TaxID=338152 RepID=A0A6I9ZRK9_ACIJB|nr:exocyst complex component 4 isoform X1 [Acinonyx jubatus]XP_030164324.1 exocyst complex component 4 isoform X1 [Lynx canadensis]XP_043445486.1 exocyst complex component 4 [Prionailurus bengalensis]XP_046951712.1 exocyst complex component 4 isoform X1 [Lynx rufus]XP_047698900.1 exocyst complex component 4 isoform X1 [Prionailurus viverrinus]